MFESRGCGIESFKKRVGDIWKKNQVRYFLIESDLILDLLMKKLPFWNKLRHAFRVDQIMSLSISSHLNDKEIQNNKQTITFDSLKPRTELQFDPEEALSNADIVRWILRSS